GSDGRIESVSGDLTLHYRQSTPTRFQISITMKRIGPSKAVIAKVDSAKAVRYSEADIAKGVASAPQSVISFEESFRLVDSITENSDSAEAFRIFTSLKNALNMDPTKAKDVIAKINSIKDRDPSSRRRLSVLFGALAQAKDPGISNLLADQAETCPDNYCKIQAIAGVNSHPNPTPEALDKMLDISQKSTDVEIAGNALLAAGSAGSRMDNPGSELSDALIKTANDPQKIAIKAAAIAAMGNHGSTDYLPVLQKNLGDPSSTNRSAAAYSMRYIADPSVDKTLIGVLSTEKDQTVLRDTLKALDYRSLSAEDYDTISKKTLAISDPETQKIGARILVQAYREDPRLVESSLNAMAAAASDADVKAYIEDEMRKIKADRAAVAKPEGGE
ncbi:MAG: HEAT repeat domain-containing protein, partial [Proteobacteria bacterium]